MKFWVLMTADTLAIESNTRVLYKIPIFTAKKNIVANIRIINP